MSSGFEGRDAVPARASAIEDTQPLTPIVATVGSEPLGFGSTWYAAFSAPDQTDLRLPMFGPPPTDEALAVARRKRREAGRRARRRAVAVLGAFGVLAGGASWVSSESGTGPSAAQPARPEQPKDVDLATWAAHAAAALVELNRQIGVIEHTHQVWLRSQTSQPRGDSPAPVRELLDRKGRLERQRASLRSELEAYYSIGEVSSDLATAQSELANLDETLRALRPWQHNDRDGLLAERDSLQRRREAKERELTSLRGGVERAVLSPLPDTSDDTAPPARVVLGLAEDELAGERRAGERRAGEQRAGEQRRDRPGPSADHERPPSVLAEPDASDADLVPDNDGGPDDLGDGGQAGTVVDQPGPVYDDPADIEGGRDRSGGSGHTAPVLWVPSPPTAPAGRPAASATPGGRPVTSNPAKRYSPTGRSLIKKRSSRLTPTASERGSRSSRYAPGKQPASVHPAGTARGEHPAAKRPTGLRPTGKARGAHPSGSSHWSGGGHAAGHGAGRAAGHGAGHAAGHGGGHRGGR